MLGAGIENEFMFTGRLDNLGMSYCSLAALLDCYPTEGHLADESAIKAIALFDHEEVGSASAQGQQQHIICLCILNSLLSSTLASVGPSLSVAVLCMLFDVDPETIKPSTPCNPASPVSYMHRMLSALLCQVKSNSATYALRGLMYCCSSQQTCLLSTHVMYAYAMILQHPVTTAV
jgi:hypothetical protein